MDPNTVSSERKLANAVGAKSARACDNCIKKRARWYCAADDAFLCQPCDLSVHSANPLARRHDRVRLKTSSTSSSPKPPPEDDLQKPAWLAGFTRKARTPRPHKKNSSSSKNESGQGSNPAHLVPEICSEDNSHDEKEEEQLLYRVPIFDPFVADMCTSNEPINHENNNISNNFSTFDFGSRPMSDVMGHFLPTEMDLAEFAADVESLLGNGLEHGPLNMEGLGILDCDDQERDKGSRAVKVEDEQIGEIFNNIDHQEGEFIGNGREGFVFNFDYDSPVLGEENKEAVMNKVQGCINDDNKNSSKACGSKIFLRLDYEGVMSAWDDHKSPWTTGERPELDSGGCWPACLGTCGTMHVYGDQMGMMISSHATIMADGGREARVSRYREKRRTRLFSKKIRYEVRKLNAEKRPRMKGRFVKRANFIAQPFTFTQ